jgi:hypothetical protein
MIRLLAAIAAWFSLPVLTAVAGAAYWRRAHREFPYFFMYVISGGLTSLTRLLVHSFFPSVYFQTYWVTDAFVESFALLATYELFVKRLFPRFYGVRLYKYLFPGAAALFALAVVPAMVEAKKVNTLLVGVHAFEVLRVAVLLFFVGLMVFMGRRWTRHEFGIALGLGVQASALLVSSTIWTKSPSQVLSIWLPLVAYDLACLIWLVTFLKSEKSTEVPAVPVSPEVLREAQQWETALKKSVAGKKESGS